MASILHGNKGIIKSVSIGNRLFGFCVLIIVSGLIILIIYPQDLTYNIPKRPSIFSKANQINMTLAHEEFRCYMKVQLIDLYSTFVLKRAKYGILQELKKFIEELNCSRIEHNQLQSASINKMEDVCPEKFMGSDYGLPFGFKQGFIFEHCSNVKPFSRVVAIIFDTVHTHYDNKTIKHVLQEIEEYYPNITVFLAVLNSTFLDINSLTFININIFKFSIQDSLASILNKFVKVIETPYVYILRDIDDFTYHSRIKRLIRVLSIYDEVAIAGGAFRDPKGYWSSNCYQTTIRNYYLSYEEGYYKSLGECMFCDYFKGPFIAKTNILKAVQFNMKLPSDIIYEELFLQIRNDSHLIFSCPDVMSFLKEDNIPNLRSSWIAFSKMHELNKIVLPNRTILEFTCTEVNQGCWPYSTTKSYLLPLCCQEIIVERIKTIVDFLDQHNITYYLIDGTLLGAVKLGIPLPWDIDVDILIDSQEVAFLKDNPSIWTSKGFTSAIYSSVDYILAKYINFRTRVYYNSIYIELFSTHNISDYTDIKYKQIPTKVKFGNIYLNTPINPGLVARNQYGKEILKHVQSWTALGQGMWDDYDAGSFLPCKKPWHHSCLDHFPADGNMELQTP